jgi:hypothetical protein
MNYAYYIKRQDQAPKKECECGCGELIPSITRRGYPARFKNGHGQKGKLHRNWKGGRYEHKGYVYILKPDHPQADNTGYIPEHRWIYEQYYNVCILPWIEIHHINGVKNDNRIENIITVDRKQHRQFDKVIDMSKRICSKCGTNKPSIRKDNGKPRWNYIEKDLVCGKCYMKWYDENKRFC